MHKDEMIGMALHCTSGHGRRQAPRDFDVPWVDDHAAELRCSAQGGCRRAWGRVKWSLTRIEDESSEGEISSRSPEECRAYILSSSTLSTEVLFGESNPCITCMDPCRWYHPTSTAMFSAEETFSAATTLPLFLTMFLTILVGTPKKMFLSIFYHWGQT